MRELTIELLGSPVLRQRAAEVDSFDDALRDLVQAMFRTMYVADGQGLAAPQVGLSQRVIVVDLRDESKPLALVNPLIVERGPAREKYKEGCLSIPGVTGMVERDVRITVEAQSPDGAPVRIEAEGNLADCIQHEVDHLEGVLFIDHLSPLERQLVLKRYKKLRKREEA